MINLETLSGIQTFSRQLRGKLTLSAAQSLYHALHPNCGMSEWEHSLSPFTEHPDDAYTRGCMDTHDRLKSAQTPESPSYTEDSYEL